MNNGPITILEDIKQRRAELREHKAEYYQRSLLGYMYNIVTNPQEQRTDREHRLCRRAAKWAMRRLERYNGWHLSANGRVWM